MLKLTSQEREEIKRLHCSFYLKFADFRITVIDFLENKVWMDDEFEKILTDNFQIIKPDF